MQQVQPKTLIVHPHIGLGIHMHQHFSSRFLIELLNKHQFCVLYSEFLKYEQCAEVVKYFWHVLKVKEKSRDFCKFLFS